MKEIMISIQPQWVEKILNGEKTIEIRKTKPKCEFPCKVYIYCTKGRHKQYTPPLSDTNYEHAFGYVMNGKVVAEFTLNGVVKFDIKSIMTLNVQQELMQKSCLGGLSLRNYLGNGFGYAWHIDNLKIYEEPKELSEFSYFIPNNKCEKHENGLSCRNCDAYNKEYDTCMACYYLHRTIKRPPQSWCYVEKGE